MDRQSSSPEYTLREYLHAKDENRPHLLSNVFSNEAELQVTNKASTIAFPAVTRGREAIAEVLVSQFNQTYENIYTYCLARPATEASRFSCDWLVGMSEKDSGNVRVGCGRYEWVLHAEQPHLATHLHITIEAMQVLPPTEFEVVFAWLQSLAYPWSSARQALRSAPGIRLLSPVLQYLGRASGA